MWERFKAAIGVEGSFGSTVFPMIAYSSANIFSGGSTYIIGIYFLSFLTEVEKLNAGQAGLVILFAKLWDAVSDPVMGLITDRTRSKYGRHRRYLLWGVIPIAVTYFMMWYSFGISALGNPLYTMVYYSAAYILFSTAYTLVVVPHTSMLPELAPAYSLRTQYNSVGYLMNSVGMVSSFMLVSITLGFFDMESLSAGSRTKFMVLGIVLCLWFSLPLIFTFKKTWEPSSLGMELPPLSLRESIGEYVQVFRNRAFRQYFVISFFNMMCTGFYSNTDQYFIKYIAQRFSLFNMLTTVSGVAEASGFPLNYWLTMKFGKQRCGKLLAPILFFGLAMGLFMNESTPAFFLFLACILYNFGFSGIGFVPTNIFPDVTDVDEMITGRRREGVISTFSSFVKKTVSGVMAAMTGFILNAFGFVTGQEDTLAQTAQGIFGVRLTFSILPMIFVVFSAISIYRYSMTKKDHEMIRAAIQEKKEKGYVTLTEEQIKRCEKISGQKFEDMWIGRYDRANEEVLQ